MRVVDTARLLALAALWGGAFLFVRVAVPPLGPIATAEVRVLLAGAVLAVTFLIPVFGMLWGAVFPGETITGTMAAGCGLVLLGTALVLARPAAAAEPGTAVDGRTVR